MTVAWEIKYPWKDKPSRHWPKGYRHTFITIWHVDPNIRGDDDSCGWFKRARHGDPAVLEKIVKRFEYDWDSVFKSDSGKTYYTGWFMPEDSGAGMPNMGVSAIALNLFFVAALVYFGNDGNSWGPARRFCQKHLFEILQFAENPTDSLRDSIVQKFGADERREARIHGMAACIYGWILRKEQHWWQHPRWHIHHWKFQVHPLQSFKRWAFTRCAACGNGFRWNESGYTTSWSGGGPQWFRSEQHVYHDKCGPSQSVVAATTRHP